MSSLLDPFDAMARLNPVPDEDALAPTRVYVPAQRTLQRILAMPVLQPGEEPGLEAPADEEPSRGSVTARRHWRLVGLVAAMVVAVVGSAAAAWVLSRSPTRGDTIVCYAAASLTADAVQARAAPGDAVDTCAEEWRSGPLAVGGGVPPVLTPCVLPSGLVGVFPGDPGVCDRLGIARLATESDGSTTMVSRIVDQLTSLTSRACLDASMAQQQLRQALVALGVPDWRIVGPPEFPADRPCASLAFDPPTKTITLVPVPDTVTSTPPGG